MAQPNVLPFGSEFSPSQVSLPELLEMAMLHNGGNSELQEAIRVRFFATHSQGNANNQRKLAMNCRLGMKAYGLIDENGFITELGHRLYNTRYNESDLYKLLARHILLHRHGMSMVQCIQDMTTAGEEVNLTTLRQNLAERGVHYPSGGKHPSIMRLWLAKAGIFIGTRWQVDTLRLREVLGAEPNDFTDLAKLTGEQRSFLLALANTGMTDAQPANEIVRLAETVYGLRFPEKSLPKLVLNPLVEAGYIVATKTTTGRGAKPFLVAPTDKLVLEIVEPLLKQLEAQTNPHLLALLRRPMADILLELDSIDRYVAGLALEALAFKLMRLLDLTYIATRLRAQATGGAEIDLLFESTRLVFSRWQVQCKNTQRVALDDVAKEVGLTHMLKSNVIVIISTGTIGIEARRYANKIMADSNLCIVMVDRTDLDTIRTQASHVVEVFNREARHAMTLKKLEL